MEDKAVFDEPSWTNSIKRSLIFSDFCFVPYLQQSFNSYYAVIAAAVVEVIVPRGQFRRS